MPAGSPRSSDVPHYVFNLTDAFDDAVVEPYVRDPRRRAHPEPVRRVQPVDQVRGALPTSRGARLRRGRHRSPRTRHRRARRDLCAAAGCRRGQGPVVRALHARSARARAHPTSRSVSSPRRRCASTRRASGCARPRRPRAWTCASSRGAAAAIVPRRAHPRARGRDRRHARRDAGCARRRRRVHDRPASRPRRRRRASVATWSTSTRARRRSRSASGPTCCATRWCCATSPSSTRHLSGRDDLTAQTRAHGVPVASTFDGTTVHFATPQPRVAPGPGGRALRRRRAARRRRSLPDRDTFTGSRRSAALRSISSRRATATMISAVDTVAPPCRPRGRTGEVDRLVEAHRHRTGAGTEAQVEHAVGCGGRRLRSHVPHVLSQEQRGVGEAERIDDHEPRGHEHRPAAGERVERAAEQVHHARCPRAGRPRRARCGRRPAAAPARRRRPSRARRAPGSGPRKSAGGTRNG